MPFKSKKQRRWEKGYRKGGLVDNIRAWLTEGEYVIRKKSAEKIGYDNLDKMNETGELPRIKDARKRRK